MNEEAVLVEGHSYRLEVLCARGGLYEFATFKVIRDNAKQVLQGLVDRTFEIPATGKSITLKTFSWLPIGKTFDTPERWTFEFLVNDNPLPVLAILAGIAILAGLALVFLTFENISEIVASPAGAIAFPAFALALLVAVVVAAWRFVVRPKPA